MKARGLPFYALVFWLASCAADNPPRDSGVQAATQWEGTYRVSRLKKTLGAAHLKGTNDDLKQGSESIDLATYRPDLVGGDLSLTLFAYRQSEGERGSSVKLSGAGSNDARECGIRADNWLDCPLRGQRVETEKDCQYWIAVQDAGQLVEGKFHYGRYYWMGPVGGKDCLAKLQEDLPKKQGLPLWQALFDTSAFLATSLSAVDSAVVADLYQAEKL